MKAYLDLTERFARIDAIDNAIGVLDWDAAVIMPTGASDGRAEQSAVLRGLAHEMLVAPDIADLLARAGDDAAQLDDWQKANLAEMTHEHAQARAVPGDLVEASARANSQCEMAWRDAREKSDFASVCPHLRDVFTLRRRVGEAVGAALGLSPHDALLNGYNPGLRCAAIDAIFSEVRRELPDLIGAVLEAQAHRPPPAAFDGPFPVEAQKRIGWKILDVLGFDFNRGRFDVSLHPFCGGAANDVRITTRYDEHDFKGALMGLLHEGGHALYEQGRPQNWIRQPVGRARGMALHESQSLLVEWHVGLSPDFLAWLAVVARDEFSATGPQWSGENLFRNFSRVERGFIRVDADEVTYPAHVLLRHELEHAMIEGDLLVADLPGAFNDGMRKYLGVEPPDDRRGCLQDIHWYAGIWGYFPSYGLGAVIAAQLFGAASAENPDLHASLARGELTPLREWLAVNVHARASSASTEDIIAQATGEALDSRHFLAHLRRRYIG